jgi:hypothetical protein
MSSRGVYALIISQNYQKRWVHKLFNKTNWDPGKNHGICNYSWTTNSKDSFVAGVAGLECLPAKFSKSPCVGGIPIFVANMQQIPHNFPRFQTEIINNP